MKHFLLTFLIALTASVSSNAQTLQVDPIFVGGDATFNISNGSPLAVTVVCYSLVGSGPYTLANGLVFDLSMPIKLLPAMVLDISGNGQLGPFSVPNRAVPGMHLWFQAAHVDPLANPSTTTTNMVPITVDAPPPPIDMVAIPGGTFEMGDHAGVGDADERPIHSVTLDAFFMDKFEVSNAKFADYLNHSNVLLNNNHVYQVGGAAQLICGLSYGLQHDGNAFVIDAGKDNHPVIFLTWYGATLYCNYLSTAQGRMPCYDATTFACDFTADGFRLPTEAEWEYASRGDEHNPYYKFPWGSDAISSTDANYGSNTSIGTTTDVGSYSANSYGLYDMAGNAVEWCNDWYDSAYYANASVSNPSGPNSGALRVARGGGWYDSGFSLRCAFRAGSAPSIRNYGVGFRAVAAQ